jgi:transcriptional regulator with XRE-family HTH domain
MTPFGDELEGEVALGARIGQRLRKRRAELGRTLAHVAGEAEVTPGYVSSIEKGASLPSLMVLARLTRALQLPLADLLRGTAVPGVAHGRIDDGDGHALLTSERSRMRIARLEGSPHSNGACPLRPLGGTDVFAYVLRGTVDLDVDGERHHLDAGDAIHCALPDAVRWSTPTADGATMLWLAGAPS